MVGLHYGHYYPNGVGFRSGFQYIPTVVEIDDSFSIPLTVTYRTGSRTTSAKLNSAAYSIARTQVYDKDDALKYGLVNFLMNLFDRIEFHSGLTPGYVAGKTRDIGRIPGLKSRHHSRCLQMRDWISASEYGNSTSSLCLPSITTSPTTTDTISRKV